MTPSVGIVIPCFNQGQFVADCVQAIERQTWPNWRAVVLNDASTDDETANACDELCSSRVAVVHLVKNLGRALVRNRGVQELGDVTYILSVDSDDILANNYVERLVVALEQHHEAGLAYGLLHFFGQGMEGRVWPTEPADMQNRYLTNSIPGPGTMIRKTALEQTAGWRQAFTICSGEDYDIWLQIVTNGWPAVWVKEAAYYYRQHAASFSATESIEKRITRELAILALHRQTIVETCGFDQFMAQFLGPLLLQSLRQFDKSSIAVILPQLLKIAPLATTAFIAKYYGRRAMSLTFQR
jgi:glycosyltransferase involved in cell wall biosynthesis